MARPAALSNGGMGESAVKLLVSDIVESGDDVDAMCDWVRSLGLDPTEIRPWLAVIHDGSGWKLHALRFRRDTAGNVHVAAYGPIDEPAAEPVAVKIPDDSVWPSWFNQLGPVELPDAPGETVVRTLWLASHARTVASVRRHEAERVAAGADIGSDETYPTTEGGIHP